MKVALGVRNEKDRMAHVTATANGMRKNETLLLAIRLYSEPFSCTVWLTLCIISQIVFVYHRTAGLCKAREDELRRLMDIACAVALGLTTG